jgi:hypothetical protein
MARTADSVRSSWEFHLFLARIPQKRGPLFDSGNRSAGGSVGRSPWTARDAPVPLPEAEAGALRAGEGARSTKGALIADCNTFFALLDPVFRLGPQPR